MKKLLVLFTLLLSHAAYAQAIKFKPEPEDWHETATPQQIADTLKALEAKQERVQKQLNLMRAMRWIAEDRADDSVKALRAAQLKEWSKVPPAKKKRTIIKRLK